MLGQPGWTHGQLDLDAHRARRGVDGTSDVDEVEWLERRGARWGGTLTHTEVSS